MLAAVLDADWKPRKGYTPTKLEEETRKTAFGSRVWRNPRLELKEIPVPDIGPSDVLLAVRACGVCGSDIHMYEKDQDGYMIYPGLTKLPMVIGHELSGQVVRIGNAVTGLKEGDMVCAEEMWWCGRCTPCRSGLSNMCENLEEMGFTKQGGFAEYLAVQDKFCYKIDSLLDRYGDEEKAFEAGSLVEPTSVAYNAMFVVANGFMPGAYLVVYGGGAIGLASVQLAKAAGAGKVIGFDVKEDRTDLLKKAGADYVFNPLELQRKGVRPSEKVMEITGGVGADMQVEAAGDPSHTLQEMQDSVAVDGKITWIGRADVTAPVFLERFQTRRAKIFGAQGHSGHGIFRNVIRLMAAGNVDMTPLITRRYPLKDISTAMQQATKRVDAKITIKAHAGT